jgi:hypothetical protein
MIKTQTTKFFKDFLPQRQLGIQWIQLATAAASAESSVQLVSKAEGELLFFPISQSTFF